MKSEKYRSLMVTPAFLEARKRKEKNDATHGRVLPPSSAVYKPTAKALQLSELKPNSSPPRLKLSLEQDSNRKIDTATHSARTREGANSWQHLKSWTIPKRLISSDCVETSEHLPSKPIMGIAANTVQKPEDEDNAIQREKTSHSSVSHHSRKFSMSSQFDLGRVPVLPNDQLRKQLKSCCPSNNKNIVYLQVPSISSENEQSLSNSFRKEVKSRDFDTEWLRKFDKEERQIIKGMLQKPTDERNENDPFTQTIQLRCRQKSHAAPSLAGRSGRSRGSGRAYEIAAQSYPNILHKTSSVAWRRDSTWLKPAKSSYQSWHGLPMHPFDTDIANITAMYMRPHKKIDSTFIIHPEWGCKV